MQGGDQHAGTSALTAFSFSCNRYYRYDDEPDARFDFCTEMWEEDEDAITNALIEGGEVSTKICADSFGVCKAGKSEL